MTAAGEWSTDDLDALPDDGRRRELLDGVLLMSRSPTRLHQTITARLGVARLDAAVHNPSWYLPEDVVLAVEIVSAGSTSMDRWLKPGAYAEAGIPFYWRVETEGGLTVHAHKLNPSSMAYEQTGAFTKDLVMTEPWQLTLPLAGLLPRQLPQR
jgi:hypothetical protein